MFLFCQPFYHQKTVSNTLIASLRMEDVSDNELTVGFSTFCKAIFYTRAKNDSRQGRTTTNLQTTDKSASLLATVINLKPHQLKQKKKPSIVNSTEIAIQLFNIRLLCIFKCFLVLVLSRTRIVRGLDLIQNAQKNWIKNVNTIITSGMNIMLTLGTAGFN